MKWLLSIAAFSLMTSASAQVWKVLPKGVRIVGYRNVTTSKISKNFNQSGQESTLGSSFRVDASTFNNMMNGVLASNLDQDAYNSLTVGEYKVDADAQMNVHGTGFGYGITDKVMYYAEIAYYNAQVKANIKRTAGNNYDEIIDQLRAKGGTANNIWAENLKKMIDADESTVQSVITNYYKYKPIGNWYGSGYGDMETGLMAKVIDKGVWGLMFYPGMVLPTGRQDDPNILQDVGFGDGQFDVFGEMATGYVVNDSLLFGTTFRYTYQAPTSKKLRIPDEKNFLLSPNSGNFDVKYGDKLNWMANSTFVANDWIAITPIYRFMYQMPSRYESRYGKANEYLSRNTDKMEHQAQLTTTFSSITPFLKKEFMLPAQINVNFVKTLQGKNIPAATRFEVEFRMLF